MPLPSRSDRRDRTRSALIAAALKTAEDQGVDSLTVDAICRRAGYTSGAFYVHFANREALLLAVMAHAEEACLERVTTSPNLAQLIAELTGARKSGPLRRGGLMAIQGIFEASPNSPAIQARYVQFRRSVDRALEPIIARDQRAGLVRADIAARELASLGQVLALGLGATNATEIPSSELHGAIVAVLAPVGIGMRALPPRPRPST
jgi:AcrR family transcriptional regulator